MRSSKLSNKVLKTVQSAFSAVSAIDGIRFRQHNLVKKLHKSCILPRITNTKYNFLWDPKKFIDFMDTLGTNKKLSLKELSQEVICLTAKRQNKEFIKHYMFFSEVIILKTVSGVSCLLSLMSSSQDQAELPISSHFINPKRTQIFCSRCLFCYMERSSNFRDEIISFLTFRKLYKMVYYTLRRYISEKWCCINTTLFRPHSARHTSLSKAKESTNVQTTLVRGGWK